MENRDYRYSVWREQKAREICKESNIDPDEIIQPLPGFDTKPIKAWQLAPVKS